MFWVGLLIALLGGLLSVGLSRETAKSRYPAVKDYHLDVVGLVLLFVGLVVSALDHVSTERQLSDLNQRTAPRHLSQEQRTKMLPILANLKGRPIAFACRMMDGESCDYATELARFVLDAGGQVPEPIKTSVNDLPGRLAITIHGKADVNIANAMANALRAARIPAEVESIKENSVGMWYPDVVHVIVGRKNP